MEYLFRPRYNKCVDFNQGTMQTFYKHYKMSSPCRFCLGVYGVKWAQVICVVICYEHGKLYSWRNDNTSIGSCSTDNKVDDAFVKCFWVSIDGLVHDCSNSIANALELQQPCIKPSVWLRIALCGPDYLIQNLVYGPVLTDDVIQNLVALRLLNKGIEM